MSAARSSGATPTPRAAIADAMPDRRPRPTTTSRRPRPPQNGSQGAAELIPDRRRPGADDVGPPGAGPAALPAARQRGVNVYECWFKENSSRRSSPPTRPWPEPSGSWSTSGGSSSTRARILLDELAENLFHTNRHPYVRYVDVETGEFWGSPLRPRPRHPARWRSTGCSPWRQNNIEYTGNPIFDRGQGLGHRTARRSSTGRGASTTSNGGPERPEPQARSGSTRRSLPPLLMQLVGVLARRRSSASPDSREARRARSRRAGHRQAGLGHPGGRVHPHPFRPAQPRDDAAEGLRARRQPHHHQLRRARYRRHRRPRGAR